jgi:hypothetical protein
MCYVRSKVGERNLKYHIFQICFLVRSLVRSELWLKEHKET